jgi:NAD(P)-dependent dehydrogenase (short-subunit alcohol dehydrogenase family)
MVLLHGNLSGRTCLVTGGAGGLGKAIATLFLQSGAKVVICDIRKDLLDATSSELSDLGPLLSLECDITDATAVTGLFEKILERFGQLDVLINNAGIMDRFDPVGDLDQSLWQKVLAVNLTSAPNNSTQLKCGSELS